MKKYSVLAKRVTRWDGSDEKAAYFGYGDYQDVKWHEVGIVEAKDEREARKLARRIYKEKGWICYFSRTGVNCLWEEVK